jgi:hypothetical protein
MLRDRPSKSELYKRIFRSAADMVRQNRLVMRRLEYPCDPIWSDPSIGASLKVLHPDMVASELAATPNEASGILGLEVNGQLLVVWPGDTLLKTLHTATQSSPAKMFVGPHHGAPKDAGSKAAIGLIEELAPERVFISVGSKNAYLHPNGGYINDLVKKGCEISCSQITKHCSPLALDANAHILKGASLLGLPSCSTGNSCRGTLRLTLNNGVLTTDLYHDIHRARVAKLRRPLCAI